MKIICLILLCASLVSANSYHVEESPVDSVVDFLKGLFDAMNEKHNFQHVVSCIKGSSDIIKDFVELWNLIKNFDSSKIVELVRHVVSTAWKTYNYVSGCKGALDEVIKLGKAFVNINVVRLISVVVWNVKAILGYITDLINAANAFNAGKALGHLVFMLFLDGYLLEVNFSLHDFVKIIEGFFAELLNDSNSQNITACLELFPELYKKFFDVLQRLKEIQFHDVIKFTQALVDLFKILIDVLEITKPCCKFPDVIDKMIHKIKNTTLHDLGKRLKTHALKLFVAFSTFVSTLAKGNYTETGKAIGEIILYLVYDGIRDNLAFPLA